MRRPIASTFTIALALGAGAARADDVRPFATPPERSSHVAEEDRSYALKLGVGFAHQRVLGTSVNAFALRGGLGGRNQIGAGYVALRWERGATPYGIGAQAFGVGIDVETPSGPIRCLVGFEITSTMFFRATNGEAVSKLGALLRLGVGVDVIRYDWGGAVYVGADMQGTWMGRTPSWGPSVLVGWRL